MSLADDVGPLRENPTFLVLLPDRDRAQPSGYSAGGAAGCPQIAAGLAETEVGGGLEAFSVNQSIPSKSARGSAAISISRLTAPISSGSSASWTLATNSRRWPSGRKKLS